MFLILPATPITFPGADANYRIVWLFASVLAGHGKVDIGQTIVRRCHLTRLCKADRLEDTEIKYEPPVAKISTGIFATGNRPPPQMLLKHFSRYCAEKFRSVTSSIAMVNRGAKEKLLLLTATM